jgi:D-arginine dehydrogenase
MRADIIVLGGGIAGLSAAAHLSRNASVLLLEGEPALGYHASGRSAAMFLPSYGNAIIRELNAASAVTHREMELLGRRDLMVVAPEGKAEAFDREVALRVLEEIDTAEARRRVPILDCKWCARAALAEGWDLDTDRCLQTHRRTALANGASIETGARVTAIDHSDRAWRVFWTGGSAEAGILLNAAGAWADKIAGLAGIAPLGLVPYRRSIAQLAAPDGHDVSGWPFVEEVGEAWYAKPDAGRWLVSPADADPVEPFDAWPDDLVLAEGLARYQEAVTVAVTRPLTTWAGLRTFALDAVPVVGPDPDRPDFWWFAGQGGYGFQIAPALAILLGERISGRSSGLAHALDPVRLRP